MPRPAETPIALQLAQTARRLQRAFDAELAAVGASLPAWLVLLSVKTGAGANQRQLAEAAGIDAATLTHHLNALDKRGLLTRERDPDNRRVHRVTLTDDGEALFNRLAQTSAAFDARLRSALPARDLSSLRIMLKHLEDRLSAGAA